MPSVLQQRGLTPEEYQLARWMLEHGNAAALSFLPHLDRACVVSRCPCGCASIDFEVTGLPPPSGGLRILAEFVFGSESDLSGAFVFERNGVLAGIEVYGLAGDAPKTLPSLDSLRPWGGSLSDTA